MHLRLPSGLRPQAKVNRMGRLHIGETELNGATFGRGTASRESVDTHAIGRGTRSEVRSSLPPVSLSEEPQMSL